MNMYARRLGTVILPVTLVASIVVVNADRSEPDAAQADVTHPVAAASTAAPLLTVTLPDGVVRDRVRVTVDPTAAEESRLKVGDTYREVALPSRAVRFVGQELQVRLAAGDVPARRIDREGGVTFVVTAEDAAGSMWTTRESAQMVTDASGRFAWVPAISPSAWAAVQSGTVSQQVKHALQVPRGHVVPRTGLRARPMVAVGKGVATKVKSSTATNALAASGLTLAAAPSHPSAKLLKKKVSWVTVGSTHPVGSSKATLEFRGYTGHSLGVATSVSGKYGSFEQSSLKKTTDAWGWKPAASSKMRNYSIEVEYGYYKVPYSCINMMGAVVCKWKYEWRPRAHTGGTSVAVISTRPSWRVSGRCTGGQSAGDWWREAGGHKAYSNSAGVKMKSEIGIDLGISRQWSKESGNSAKAHYRINTKKPKILCGNNDHPARSGSQVEYYK